MEFYIINDKKNARMKLILEGLNLGVVIRFRWDYYKEV